MIDTLVLSGNSTNGIAILGATQYLFDNGYLADVRRYVGTSSGAIIGALLAVGYQPIDILTRICAERLYSTVSDKLSFGNLITSQSLLSYHPIRNAIERMIRFKISRIPTLLELYETYNVELVCCAYDISDDRRVYISKDTNPSFDVLESVCASSTYPFVFEPFQASDGNYYIDGGVVDSFPIEHAVANFRADRCVGVYVANPPTPFARDASHFDLLRKIFQIVTNSQLEDKRLRVDDRVATLVALNLTENFFKFSASNADIIQLFDEGYDQCADKFLSEANKNANRM